MAHPVRYLIALLSLANVLSAQGPRAGDQALRFTVFSVKPIAGLLFVPRPAESPEHLVFYPTARSPRYNYLGVMPLRFIDGASGAVVAEAVLPPDIHDALLLFTALEPASAPPGKPAKGLRYQISVLDDGFVHHASGGLAIINLSGLELTGRIGMTDITLKAGLNPAVPVGHSAKILFRTTLKGRSYQSYADTLQLQNRERALLILFPPFSKGSFEVQWRMLVDQPPAPPTSAAGR